MNPGPITADPVKLFKLLWPHLRLYDKQREILYSVWENTETVVPAGHKLGKDFISGAATILFFVSRGYHPCRIVTTSVQGHQLNEVLWGEIRWLIKESQYQLPIQYNHMHVRKRLPDGDLCGKSYVVGKTTDTPEALSGHHAHRILVDRFEGIEELPWIYGNDGMAIPTTLAVFDEASGIPSVVYDKMKEWSHRRLIIGNPYPCTNFFYKMIEEEGEIESFV